MSINDLLAETACRLRWYLGSSADEKHATDEEAILALIQAEHQAAQHQLPMWAASRHTQCAHTNPTGHRCQAQAITPPVYGWLCRNPNARVIYRRACWPFIGALCQQHVSHLIVPPASWWPVEQKEEETALV